MCLVGARKRIGRIRSLVTVGAVRTVVLQMTDGLTRRALPDVPEAADVAAHVGTTVTFLEQAAAGFTQMKIFRVGHTNRRRRLAHPRRAAARAVAPGPHPGQPPRTREEPPVTPPQCRRPTSPKVATRSSPRSSNTSAGRRPAGAQGPTRVGQDLRHHPRRRPRHAPQAARRRRRADQRPGRRLLSAHGRGVPAHPGAPMGLRAARRLQLANSVTWITRTADLPPGRSWSSPPPAPSGPSPTSTPTTPSTSSSSMRRGRCAGPTSCSSAPSRRASSSWATPGRSPPSCPSTCRVGRPRGGRRTCPRRR